MYLDTEGNRLYLGGKALDVRVIVDDTIDEYYQRKRSYRFVGPDETVTIADALIPPITDFKIQLHDIDERQEAEYSNGLMSFRDKFVLDTICKLLGIEIEYTYWATVHHYSDVLNKHYEALSEVQVYKNDDDEWQYDYEDFMWNFYDQATETATLQLKVPAGSITLRDNGIYPLPATAETEDGHPMHPTGNPVVITDVEGIDEIITVRAKTLKMIRTGKKDYSFFDGGGRPESQQMLFDHGGLKAGTTVGELQELSVSEVLARILFQIGTLKKVSDTKAYVKFSDEYIEKFGVETAEGLQYIEIGADYPLSKDFQLVFVPETWVIEVDGQPYGEPQYVTELESVSYWINDEQHPWIPGHGPTPPGINIYDLAELEKPGYDEHYLDHYVEAGDKSVYFAKVKYRKVANPVDQFGHEVPIDTQDGEFQSFNYLCFTGVEQTTNPTFDNDKVKVLPEGQEFPDPDEDPDTIFLTHSLTAVMRIYTNATETSHESPWDRRNEDPGTFTANNAWIEAEGLTFPGQSLYFRWPAFTPESEHFYVYIPGDYTIAEISSAHDGANDEWSVRMEASEVFNIDGTPEIITIQNRYGIDLEYHKFEISKCAGITNARIRFARRD